MNPIWVILLAFRELCSRGVQAPLYCRMVLKGSRKGECTRGWLWREGERIDDNVIRVGEKFTLTVMQERPNWPAQTAEVLITWRPTFYALIQGSQEAKRLALWFLHSDPRISGGTHQSVDQFRHGAADWSLASADFFLVRCGSYEGGWRHPSKEALEWVQDPERFLVPEFVRKRVLAAMKNPLKTGEHLTIRRIFHNAPVRN